MPQPATSSQPVCLQTRQPCPPHSTHWMSTSADGSVNGKYEGRSRIVSSRSKNASMNWCSTAFRFAKLTSLVDQQPLDLVEHRRVGHVRIAAIDAAGRDQRERRRVAPCITRICTGEVWVRSSWPSSR